MRHLVPGGVPTEECSDNRFVSGAGPHVAACECRPGFCSGRTTISAQLEQSLSATGGFIRVISPGSAAAGPNFDPNDSSILEVSASLLLEVPFETSEMMAFSVLSIGCGFALQSILDDEGNGEFLEPSGVLVPGRYMFRVTNGLVIRNDSPPSSIAFNDSCTLQLGQAGDFRWTNAAGGPYDVPTNWEINAVPVHSPPRSDTVIFGPVIDNGGNEVLLYAVSASGATAGRFVVERAFLDLDGTAEVFGTSSVEPSLTIFRGGTLILDDAARLRGVNASVGFSPNVPGLPSGLVISSAGSDCTLSGRLIVGEFSEGGLVIDTGGTLSCTQAIVGDIAVGNATVTGVDSRWDTDTLTIGAINADGAVEIREGGHLAVTGRMVVSDLFLGTLALIDGGKATVGEAEIGVGGSGVGVLRLQGDSGPERSLLDVAGALRVGVGGTGVLEVRDGSAVRSRELRFAPTGTGVSIMIVGGTSAQNAPSELTVSTPALLSRGQLDVADGASANFPALTLGSEGRTEVRVAGFAAPGGVVDTNFSATLTTARLAVGHTDRGLLTVEEGGRVTCTELQVGSGEPDGSGTVIVANAGIVNVSGPLRASGRFQAGESNVKVLDGGLLFATALLLGTEASSSPAELVMRGVTNVASSQVIVNNGPSNGPCAIGIDGPGVLRLADGTFFIASGSATVGGSATGGSGLVEIGSDSLFSVGGDLDVGGASPGTIKLLTSSSTLSITGSIEVNDGGRIEGIGTLDVTGARIVNPGGFISPGLSPGTLTIDGDYEQGEGGTLIIEVAGLDAGQFDVLKVTGNATLAGTVDLRFIDGFVPRPGDSVDFVQVDGTITGKLTGGALVNTDDGTAQAEIKWEVTDEGTCRLIVTDVTALDFDGNPLPSSADCGAGLCGAGVVPMLPLTCFGLAALRTCSQRRRAIVRRYV